MVFDGKESIKHGSKKICFFMQHSPVFLFIGSYSIKTVVWIQ